MSDRGTGRWSNEAVQNVMGNVLRGGVILAAALVALGGAVLLMTEGRSLPDYTVFHRAALGLRDPLDVLRGAAAFRAADVIELGLFVLILTPVARVVFSAWAFAVQRDRLYVVLTGIVLVVLAFSLAGRTL